MSRNSGGSYRPRTAIELYASAADELGKSQIPEQRLSAGVRELATAEHNLTSYRVEDDR